MCCHPLAAVGGPLWPGQPSGRCGQQRWVGSKTSAGPLLLQGAGSLLPLPAAPPARVACGAVPGQGGRRELALSPGGHCQAREGPEKDVSLLGHIPGRAGEVRPLEATAGTAGPWMGGGWYRGPDTHKAGGLGCAEPEPLPAGACSPPPTALAGLLAGGRLLTRLVAESGDGLVFCLPADPEVVAAFGWE